MNATARLVLAALGLAGAAPLSAQQLERLSEPEDPFALGTLADGLSEGCRIAGGRWTVFVSRAANLVADDRNASDDVFVRDRVTGAVERASVDSAGAEADGANFLPDISDDGRYVVFQSQARLAAGPTFGVGMVIYLRDRSSGTTTMVSRSFDGSSMSGSSLTPRIDGPGTTVVYASSVSNLVPGDTNNATDIFAYDIATGATTLVSTSAAGAAADSPSRLPDVSDGGRYVVFASDAANLVAGDTNNARDVFLKDRTSGTVTRVSEDAAGVGGNGFSDLPVVDASGDRVAFASFASNLVAGDTLNRQDVFVWERTATPRVSRVSLSSTGAQGDRDSRTPSIGNDARYVLFDSAATNLAPGQITTPSMQPFLHDRQTGTTRALLSVAGQTTVGAGSLDSAGSLACVASAAALDAADANGLVRDVFAQPVAGGAWSLESRTAAPVPAPAANGASVEPETSPDGRYVAFASTATNLDAAAVARASSADVYWMDRDTGAIERWPLAPGGIAPNAGSGSASVSAGGRYLAFSSAASNLVPGVVPASHVYRLDRSTGALVLATAATTTGTGGGERPQLSDGGLSLVFQSTATGLVAGDTNAVRDVFLWQEAQPLRRISIPTGGGQADRESRAPRLAGGGAYAVFVSAATNLVGVADSAGFDDIFRVDLATGDVLRISQTAAGLPGDGHSRAADVSADGRYVAFSTDARNLVTTIRTGPQVLRWDAQGGGFVDASANLPPQELVDPDLVRISDDGRHVVLATVVQVGSAFTENLWRVDLDTGVLRLMSSDGGSNRNGGQLSGFAVDAQGAVLFAANDDALLAGDGNGTYDIYRSTDGGAAGLLQFATATITVTEGVDDDAILVVRRSDGSTGAVGASFATQPDSASSVLDFGIRQGIASFPDGDTNDRFLVVPILDDDLVEGPEQFRVVLSAPTGGVALGPVTVVTVTILDDDAASGDLLFAAGFEP
jgi:Tol biopolymer transport system component